jgi:hypothetical protein
MELLCKCGNNCFKAKQDTLKDFKNFFNPCPHCEYVKLKKFSPLSDQLDINLIDAEFKRCICGKRHLDVVMAHILKIMIKQGIKDQDSTLRNVCVPLITPAYPTDTVPYLFENSLVILADVMDKKCAKRIVDEIPEVKGVLKGDLKDTVGVKDSNTQPSTYKLMAGCDLRCDIIYTPWDDLCIYKYQGQIHIEVPRPLPPKIMALQKSLKKYDSPTVLDCTCGPGTLGIAALQSGARQVVFNDLWYPACQATAMNLEVNGFKVSCTGSSTGLIASGDGFKLYCLDVKDLAEELKDKFDLCLIDVFPGVDTRKFTESVKNICREVVII